MVPLNSADCAVCFSASPHLCPCDATLIVTLKNTTLTCFTSCLCLHTIWQGVNIGPPARFHCVCVEHPPGVQMVVTEIEADEESDGMCTWGT